MTTTSLSAESTPLAVNPEDEQKFHTADVTAISVGHAINDTYQAFLAPLLPIFITTLELSNTRAGLLAFFLQLPSLVQPLIGAVSDRMNLRWVVFTAPAVTAIAMSLLGIIPNYTLLVILLICAGISSAGYHSLGPVVIGKRSGRSLGRGMSFWMVGGELGRTLGPLVVVSAVGLLTIKGLPWLIVLGIGASVLLFSRLRTVPDARQVVGSVAAPKVDPKLLARVMLPIAGILIFRSFMMSSLSTFLPTFLTNEGANLWFAGASLSVMEVAAMAGALLGGTASDKLGRRTVLIFSLVATPLAMLLFLNTQGWAQALVLLLIGFSILALTPVLMAVVQESFPENRALANGIFMAISFIIQATSALVVGAAADAIGLRSAYWLSVFIFPLGIPLVFLLPRKPAATAA